MLLTFYLEQWQWQGRASWELALSAVDYGAVLYAMLAVLVEKGGSLMFWAWEKHKERVAKREERMRVAAQERLAKQERMREELREEGRQEGREEALAEILAVASAEEKPVIAEVAQRVAQARNSRSEHWPPQ